MTTIDLQTKIDTANTSQSLGEIRKSLKDLISLQGQVGAGSAEFKKLQKAINDTESKLGYLNDSINTLRGSGVERLNASFGLLREGLAGGDIDKASIAFKGLGSAMDAVPLLLLVEGVKALIENFDGLVKLFDTGQMKTDKMTKALEEQKRAFSILAVTIGNQIKILEAQGGSEEKIIKLKKQLIELGIKEAQGDIILQKQKIVQIQINDSLFESGQKLLAQQQRAIGNTAAAEAIEKSIALDKQKRIKEATDQLEKDYSTIQTLRTENTVNEIKEEKRKREEKKKVKETFDSLEIKDDAKLKETKIVEKDIELSQLQGVDDKYKQLNIEAERRFTDEQKAEFNKRFNNSVNLAAQSTKAVQGLSDALFAGQLANTKKGSAEELTIKKKQFEINKKLAIAQAIIDGVKGVQSQLQAGPIIGPILAGLVGVTAAINVNNIRKQQFDGGGSISSTGSNVSTGGGATIPNQSPQSLNFNKDTVGNVGTINNQQNNSTQRVVLVSHDVTRAQKNDKIIEMQATFG